MRYRALVLKLASDIRASYWFIPTCLVIVAGIVAELLVNADQADGPLLDWLPSALTNTQVEGARTILSVIAQSVIGVTGVMFSVTMVAVSFASGNFGPRLVGNFMRDRGNQWSLGILIATFVYALVVLRSIQSPAAGGPEAFVPQVALLVAFGLAFLSVFVMIFFVHHVPETINVSNISAALGRRFCVALAATARDEDPTAAATVDLPQPVHDIALTMPGYVQRVEVEQLNDLAVENDLRVRVTATPGSFLHAEQSALQVSGGLSDDLAESLRSCFALGESKTEDQNVLFLAEQQVEMIARALSPGVNDPYTAINCLNWLAAGIAAGAAKGNCFGLSGCDRVTVPPIDARTLLEATFGAAHPYIADDEMVLAHWTGLLDELADVAGGRLAEAVRVISDKPRHARSGTSA